MPRVWIQDLLYFVEVNVTRDESKSVKTIIQTIAIWCADCDVLCHYP